MKARATALWEFGTASDAQPVSATAGVAWLPPSDGIIAACRPKDGVRQNRESVLIIQAACVLVKA